MRGLLDAGPKRSRSKPEAVLLRAIRAAGLPEPETNARIGRWEADLYWPAQRVVVEVDGYAAHSSPRAFERDRRKAADLEARGLTVRRVSALQVRDDLERTVGRLARALRD
jgi:very-short-patch-repair endonuclease